MEVGQAFQGEGLGVGEIAVGGVGLGGEESAVGCEDVEIADGHGEELEGEGDGGVAAHVGEDGADVTTC